MDLIVLSPHFDDAVVSAGGMIARAVAEGKSVQVVTFGTREPEYELPVEFLPFADYEKRKQEDQNALSFLGASFTWLDFYERAFRKPQLKKLRDVFRTPKSIEEFTDLAEKIRQVEKLLEENDSADFVCPLGIGNHYDHVELFLAAARVMTGQQAFDRFRFYEDAYAMMTRARKKHFLAKKKMWSPKDAPEKAGFKSRVMAGVMTGFMKGPPLEEFLDDKIRGLSWKMGRVLLGEYEQKKIEAVAMYQSQLKLLGGKAFLKMLKRYHVCFEGAEPLWLARPVNS